MVNSGIGHEELGVEEANMDGLDEEGFRTELSSGSRGNWIMGLESKV